MEERYIYKNNKKLRCGFTTGSCAAASAKAATLMLFEKIKIDYIEIDTPKGWKLKIDLIDVEIKKKFVKCGVQKDAGDDPDITNGIKIYAKVEFNSNDEIIIKSGVGIGIVTKKGLPVKIGNPAINPVPLQMIKDEIKKVLPEGRGIIVEISAPQGVDIAKKTFNPKLGIIDGISILGTTGIVEPMSEEAFKDSLALKLSILKEEQKNYCVFTPGNIGEKFIETNYNIPKELIVITSNFIGFMLEKAVFYKFKNILLAGHIGKLIKVAGGIFHTHSKIADGRNEILASNYGYFTNDTTGLKKIMESNTIEEALDYIKNLEFYKFLAEKIKQKCENYIFNEINIEVILISTEKGILTSTKNALKMLSYIKGELF